MGKYGKYERRIKTQERPWEVHPIWRGIGCLLILIIPPMAYAGGIILVRMNMERGWVPVSAEIMRPILVPVLGIMVDHLYANLMAGGALMVLAFAIMMFIYTLIYGLMGPSRFGPLDARPIRSRPPRRKKF